jgi:hypothetical protein
LPPQLDTPSRPVKRATPAIRGATLSETSRSVGGSW